MPLLFNTISVSFSPHFSMSVYCFFIISWLYLYPCLLYFQLFLLNYPAFISTFHYFYTNCFNAEVNSTYESICSSFWSKYDYIDGFSQSVLPNMNLGQLVVTLIELCTGLPTSCRGLKVTKVL